MKWLLRIALVLLLAPPALAAPPESPEKIITGTKVCGVSASVIATVGSGFAIRLRNTSATASIKYGDATPALTLGPELETAFDIADFTGVYCQRVGGSDVTIEWAVLTP